MSMSAGRIATMVTVTSASDLPFSSSSAAAPVPSLPVATASSSSLDCNNFFSEQDLLCADHAYIYGGVTERNGNHGRVRRRRRPAACHQPQPQSHAHSYEQWMLEGDEDGAGTSGSGDGDTDDDDEPSTPRLDSSPLFAATAASDTQLSPPISPTAASASSSSSYVPFMDLGTSRLPFKSACEAKLFNVRERMRDEFADLLRRFTEAHLKQHRTLGGSLNASSSLSMSSSSSSSPLSPCDLIRPSILSFHSTWSSCPAAFSWFALEVFVSELLSHCWSGVDAGILHTTKTYECNDCWQQGEQGRCC